MVSRARGEFIPKPIRRILNLLRRYPFLTSLLGERPAEPAVKNLYSQYISKNDVVVEIGARMGDGTRLLADIAAHVYSFEPARYSFFVLKRIARMRHNVTAYNLAVGDRPAVALLSRDRSFSGVASIKKIANVDYVAEEKVKVVTLDSLNFNLPPTSLVVDCEGYEEEVLKGAVGMLPHLKSVLVETHTLSDGSNTLDSVVQELSRFFPSLWVKYVGHDCWVVCHR